MWPAALPHTKLSFCTGAAILLHHSLYTSSSAVCVMLSPRLFIFNDMIEISPLRSFRMLVWVILDLESSITCYLLRKIILISWKFSHKIYSNLKTGQEGTDHRFFFLSETLLYFLQGWQSFSLYFATSSRPGKTTPIYACCQPFIGFLLKCSHFQRDVFNNIGFHSFIMYFFGYKENL